MKKILTVLTVMAMCSGAAYAQNAANDSAKNHDAEKKVMTAEERHQKREAWMKNMSPEQKQHMEERRQKFEALSPEKKKEVRAEMKRHRENMEKITGEKMPMHHHEMGMHDMDK